MDLSSLLPSDCATMTLRHPATGADMPGMTISLYGTDSAKFRELQKDAAREILSRKRGSDVDMDAADKKAIARLAELTVSIEGIEDGGKPVTDAAILYTKFKWVREQADVFIADRANFLPSA